MCTKVTSLGLDGTSVFRLSELGHPPCRVGPDGGGVGLQGGSSHPTAHPQDAGAILRLHGQHGSLAALCLAQFSGETIAPFLVKRLRRCLSGESYTFLARSGRFRFRNLEKFPLSE